MTQAAERIRYRSGIKYWLADLYDTQLAFVMPGVDIETDFIRLSASGRLLLRRGFPWNGASGALDDRSSMRGSAVHDALYELMAAGLLDPTLWREASDNELRRILVEDKMHPDRAEIWFNMVRKFGGMFARNEKPIHIAP